MSEAPYHHGNLRAALLAAARKTLHDRGAGAISLRELARETGVSKSAPSRHFPDKQSLLRAVAVDGFEQLHDAIDRSLMDAGDVYVTQLRAAAGTFVDFAVKDAALLDLMFSLAKKENASEVHAAANRVYTAIWGLIERGQDDGELLSGDPTRLQLLMTATLQGIASLASTGRVGRGETAELLDDAIDLFRSRAAFAEEPDERVPGDQSSGRGRGVSQQAVTG